MSPDRPDARHPGALVLVSYDEAALVYLDAHPVRHQPFGAGAPPHRHDDGFDVPGLLVRLDRREGAILRRRVRLHHDPGHDVDAALLERSPDETDDVLVTSDQDAVQRLEDRDLGAQVGQQRGELAADHATTDDGDRRRKLLQIQELVGGHDPAAVHLEPGQHVGHRSGRQHHVAPDDHLAGVLAVDHLDPVVGQERPRPCQGGHLAPLEQALEALEELVHDGVLAVLAPREVHRHAADVDAELLGPFDRPVDGGRLEELLGRDAASVQAGPAHLVPLDDGDGETRRRAVESRGVPTRAATDHDDVELFLACHRSSSSCPNDVRPTRSAPPRTPDRTGPSRALLRACSPAAYRSPHHDGPGRRAPIPTRVRRDRCRPPSWPAHRRGRSSGRPNGP